MNIAEIIRSELSGSHKLTFFCGAGISRNSNIPTVNDSYHHLAKIFIEDSCDRKLLDDRLCSHEIPFERIMQLLISNSASDSFLDMYLCGYPNINHITIAKLAKAGLVQNIVTTNFDLLFERALEFEGMQEGTDFKIFFAEDHFPDAVDANTGFVRLIKLHGSAGNSAQHKKSIRVTLSTIVQQILSKKRQTVINHLFTSDTAQHILFLGYSFSDIFDINPHIRLIKDLLKPNIIVVEHSGNEHKEDIGIRPIKNPFEGLIDKGSRVYVPTDSFIKELWQFIPDDNYEETTTTCIHNIIGDSFNWQFYFDQWLHSGEPGMAAYLSCKIFDFFELPQHQLKYALLAHELSANGSNEWQAETILQVGFAYKFNGEISKTVQWYEKGFEFIKQHKKEETKIVWNNLFSKFNFQMGRYFENYTGDFRKAIKYYGQCYRYDCKTGNREAQAKTLHQLGAVMTQNAYKIKQAEKCNTKGKEIKESLGDLAGAAKSILQSGNYCFLNRLNPEALEFYREALAIVSDIGEISMLGYLHHNMACVNHNMENLDIADYHYNQAIFYKSIHPFNLSLTTSLGNKATLYYSFGYSTIAYHLFLASLNLYQYFKHDNGILSNCCMIARVYLYADYPVFEENILNQYLLTAEKIMTDGENIHERNKGDYYFMRAELAHHINNDTEATWQYLRLAADLLINFPDYKFIEEMEAMIKEVKH